MSWHTSQELAGLQDEIDRLRSQLAEMRKGESVAWIRDIPFFQVILAKHLESGYIPNESEGWYALFLAAPTVPEGWKPVPVDATPEMLRAGYNAMSRRMYGQAGMSDADFVWDAMLNVAPEPKED